MREVIKAALAILAASTILWAVEPARAEVQDSGKQMLAECASEVGESRAQGCRTQEYGQGRLFDGFLKLAPRCNVCGLDYSFADPADGPAFFVMMIMSWPVAKLR